MKNSKSRRLTAIMFTDIVGYTALMQKDEKLAAAIRNQHRQKFEQYHHVYNGEILQYFGDGTLSVFQSGVQAVECAIAIQRALLREDPVVPLRIGLHMGDIVFDGTDIYGDGVNLASRIESMGVAGGILLSGTLNDELKNHQQISTHPLGQFKFKNVTQSIDVFSINNEGIIVPTPSLLEGKQENTTKTIAVLPFVNMSASEENEYFSDGITEEIINALAKIKNLKVTSRTSSFFFKNKNIPLPEIGRELNVSTILEGSVRLSGNKMRITAQLIDVADDFHFFSETFDRILDDVFVIQDEVSLLIADKLREHIGHFDIGDHLVENNGLPLETYKKYLQGRFYLMKLTRPSTEKAITLFKEVIILQPDFAQAYLDINQGYTFLGTMGLMPAGESFAKAKPFLDKAIELDENLLESQLNLAWISCWQNWDLKSTYQHINQALEIRPTDVLYLTMSNTLTVEGKLELAHNYIDKALELAPLTAMNHHYKGFLYYLQEKYEIALPYFEKSLQLKPDLPFPILYIGEMLILTNRAKEGLAYFQKLSHTADLTKLGGSTLAYAASNDLEKTTKGIEKLEAALQSESMGSAMNFLIFVHTQMGNPEKAIQLIEQGISYKLPMMLLLNTEPMVKPLRSYPRFQELMKEIFDNQSTFSHAPRKYKKSLLDHQLLKQNKQALERLMEKEKPFLDPTMTLRSLAETLELPPNHLSQLLNEGFDKNFSEFINTYRVETFKSKAADPRQQHLTILALAYDSGFNSKTVFNTFFKKTTGMTPKAYWKTVMG